jgi:hypothetical protein
MEKLMNRGRHKIKVGTRVHFTPVIHNLIECHPAVPVWTNDTAVPATARTTQTKNKNHKVFMVAYP